MGVSARRGALAWRGALLLIFAGMLVGYVSFENLDIWGAGGRHYQLLWFLGFAVGSLAFISGCLAILSIALKALTSSRESRGQPAPESAPVATRAHDTVVGRRPAGEGLSSRVPFLRTALLTIILFEALSIWRWGAPSLASNYGKSYWLINVLGMLLTQVPFVVALVRVWGSPDRAGIALAVVSSAALVLFDVSAGIEHYVIPHEPWPWLAALAALIAIALGALAWRSEPARPSDNGLAISIAFGFVVYTVLARIALAILRARLHV